MITGIKRKIIPIIAKAASKISCFTKNIKLHKKFKINPKKNKMIGKMSFFDKPALM